MKGISVPDRTEDFTADPVELFFDLAYVFAFSQLVGRLLADHTWGGVGETALIFGLLWLPWQQLTWAANAVSGNGRAVRVIFLLATVACVPMAASTSTALTSGGRVFAVSLAAMMALGFAVQGTTFEPGTRLNRSALRWIVPNAAAMVVLLAGSLATGPARTAVWTAALLIVLGAMIAAGSGEWLIRSAHFAERHGLIYIIALGEVIVAIGIPVVNNLKEGNGVPGPTVAALVTAGAFAAILWWGYFDRPGPALEHRAESLEHGDRGRFVRDVYTWAHAPIVAGVILSAAGLEQITLHPTDAVPVAFRVMLASGTAFVFLGIVVAIWRAFRRVPHERVAATVAVAAVTTLGGDVHGVVLLVAVVAVMFFALVVEHRRIEGPASS